MTVEYTIPIRVYYEDTDAVGIVYYGNYLRFMERCRTEWLRHIGFDIRSVTERFGVIFAVHSANLRFLKPARLSDLLSVSMAIEECGRASLQIRQEIHCGEERLSRNKIPCVSTGMDAMPARYGAGHGRGWVRLCRWPASSCVSRCSRDDSPRVSAGRFNSQSGKTRYSRRDSFSATTYLIRNSRRN